MRWAFRKMFYKTLNPSQKKFIFSPSQKKTFKIWFHENEHPPLFPPLFSHYQ